MAGKHQELAARIVQYMVDYDLSTLSADAAGNGAIEIIGAYEDTLAQVQGDGWVFVAWYLVQQFEPSNFAEKEAYDLLEELFSDHGIG